jgi:hypothetical protein
MAESKFVSYLRISTDKQGRNGLGLEAQRGVRPMNRSEIFRRGKRGPGGIGRGSGRTAQANLDRYEDTSPLGNGDRRGELQTARAAAPPPADEGSGEAARVWRPVGEKRGPHGNADNATMFREISGTNAADAT